MKKHQKIIKKVPHNGPKLIRKTFQKKHWEGLEKTIQRIQTFARMLDRQRMVVVVSALYAHPNLLEWNRENFSDYFEIYLEAPLEVVMERDPKGLYAKVARGEMQDVVGIDLPWHAPVAPDLKIKMEPQGKAEEVYRQIVGAVPLLADLEERENATTH